MTDLNRGILQTTVTVASLDAKILRAKLIASFTENDNLAIIGKIHEEMHSMIDASHTAQIELIAYEEHREIRCRRINVDMDDCGD